MMIYKDTTFCIKKCMTTSCHRNREGPYYGKGPKELYMPLSLADFSKECTHYQPKDLNENNKS